MRITKISVKGLFGMFDHEIPLNQESRITIVHGPNGVGKTVLLQLVHSLFHCEYELVGKISFECLRVDFENGDFITVRNFEEVQKLLIRYDNGLETAHVPFSPRTFLSDAMGTVTEKLMLDVEFIRVAGRPRWKSHTDSPLLTEKDLLNAHPEVHALVYGETPDWFVNLQTEVNVALIQTQRLKRDLIDDDEFMRRILDWDIVKEDEIVPSSMSVVEEFSRDVSSKLIFVGLNLPLVIRKIKDQDSKVRDLLTAEFGDSLTFALGRFFRWIVDLSEDEQEHVTEVFRKYAVDFLTESRTLLVDLINERFLFKTMAIGEQGLVFTADDDSEIPLTGLSSGEQHLVVLYCQLLVGTGLDSLVMIDEPELSLNVVWQRRFLEDLQRIIDLQEFHVLIATHSPQIIGDKWDWMVPLGEKMDD